MKKNRLSIIFAILTCICIFSVAAIADQCGCRAVPLDEKVDIGEEVGISEETEGEDGSEEIAEEEIRLTNNSADDGRPFWSPDGKMIAFGGKVIPLNNI